jgi:hypothetical protein
MSGIVKPGDWRAHIEENGPGVYDISAEDYHAQTWALSSSGARTIVDASPAKFKADQDEPRKATPAMEFGTAAHLMMLERHFFADSTFVLPEGYNGTLKKWQEVRAAKDEAEEAGLIVLTNDAHKRLVAMSEAMQRHPMARVLLSKGKPEQSLFWFDDRYGIWRRARADLWFSPSGFYLFDYKTKDDACNDAVSKGILDWGYYCQEPWYLDGVKALGLSDKPAFRFIVQEKTKPFDVRIVPLTMRDREAGRIRNDYACWLFAECTRRDHWLGYDEMEYLRAKGEWPTAERMLKWDYLPHGRPEWAAKRFDNENDAGFYTPPSIAAE